MTRDAILVTGGAGFVGSHACKGLARSGFIPVVYDNLTTGHRDTVRWGPLEVGDICDGPRLHEVIQRYKPVAVMHFAACMEAGESIYSPIKFYKNNVAGTISLLEAMKGAGIDKLIFSSTAAVYGKPLVSPISEDHPCSPINPYGQTKLTVERILADVAAAHALRYCALRYFNAAGADPEGELSENHSPETHLIPLALQTAFGLKEELSLFGSDYETPDGTCIRDYVHVSDLALAHVLAAKRLLDGQNSFTTNLGTGNGYSVRTIIDTVQTVTGRSVKVVSKARRAGDPAMLIADATRAHTFMGWRPQYKEIEQIVRHAAAKYGAEPFVGDGRRGNRSRGQPQSGCNSLAVGDHPYAP